MATDSAQLFIECQHALRLTQKQMGELLGRDRRTIQRWQSRGSFLLPSEAHKLAEALRPVRPDLAEKVIALGQEFAVPPEFPATPGLVADILSAAADAIGSSPSAVRPAVVAAFAEAAESGVSAGSILVALLAGAGGSESSVNT